MEQNQLAWVTCHSEATLLGQLCFKNIFLSQNLLFPQMPTLPTLVSWVPAPWVRARTPSAFASPANSPGSSFFSPIFYGTFQIPSQLEKVTLPAEDNPLAWDLPWVRGSSVTIRPSLHKFLPPRINFCLPALPQAWHLEIPLIPGKHLRGLIFLHRLLVFSWFTGGENPRKTQKQCLELPTTHSQKHQWYFGGFMFLIACVQLSCLHFFPLHWVTFWWTWVVVLALHRHELELELHRGSKIRHE